MKTHEPTLFDKLFDGDPRTPTESVLRRFALDDFKDSIAQDLESLLNTRLTIDRTRVERFMHCSRSLATYGVADFSGLSLASFDDRQFICESLRDAIERHEPRLKDVSVVLEIDAQAINLLRFTVSAVMNIGSQDEPVGFDAMLQPTSLQYSVKHSRPRR